MGLIGTRSRIINSAALVAGVLFLTMFPFTLTNAQTLDSMCLGSGWPIQTVAAGTYSSGFDFTPSSDPRTYDARGVKVNISMVDSNVKNGFVLRNRLNNQCVLGVEVRGTQPRDMAWDDVGHGGDCIGFRPGSQTSKGQMIVEGVYTDNCGGDAIDPAKDFSTMGDGYSWNVRHSYFRHTRDDLIENDACHPGEVYDVLADDTFMFISTRPSRDNYGTTGATAPIIKVTDSLIHAKSGLFKWPEAVSGCDPEPRINMSNTILRADGGATNPLNFPAGTYSNVTLVWTGSGSYPGNLPSSGVTVTKDISVWNDARADWLSRHGCDQNGNSCNNLLNSSGGGTAGGTSGGATGGTTGGTSGGSTGGTSGGTTGGTTGGITEGMCNGYSSGSQPPTGYGAAWNTLNSAKELLVSGYCYTNGNVKYTVGSGGNQYVYKMGYYYTTSPAGWNPFTLTGTYASGSDSWILGKGVYTNAAAPSYDYYFWVGYVCQWTGREWNCGCRDSACTQSYWQLQQVKQ
jgi:hypothetical protein